MQLSHNKGSISKACQKMDLKKKKKQKMDFKYMARATGQP